MGGQWNRPVLGILGGMGALASAEFLKSIYETGSGPSEQDSPIVLVVSDPTIPDRTEALLHGDDEELLERLVDGLRRLRGAGASRIVICCMTAHHLLPRLPAGSSDGVISLLDVIFAQVHQSVRSHLVICSTGTRRLNPFQNHPR
jgi:aspartate racemase